MIITNGTKRLVISECCDSYDNPREWGNTGTIVGWHRRYNLGDEQPGKSPEEWMQDITGWDKECPVSALELFDTLYIWLPVYMYEHSGVALNTGGFSCPWDSGQVGYVFVARDSDTIQGMNEEAVFANLRSEIETYSLYLNGEVYTYSVEEWDEEMGEWVDTYEGCGGFYGHDPRTNGMAEYCPWIMEEGAIWSD